MFQSLLPIIVIGDYFFINFLVRFSGSYILLFCHSKDAHYYDLPAKR